MFFKEEKIERYLKDLKSNLTQKEIKIKEFEIYPADLKEKTLPDFKKLKGEQFQTGDNWGEKKDCLYFKAEITFPDEWENSQANVYLELIAGEGQSGGLSGTESLLYLNGSPVQGLDHNHSLYKLNGEEIKSSKLTIVIKAYKGRKDQKQQFKKAALIYRDKNLEKYYKRAKTVLEALKTMTEGELLREKLLKALNQSINIIDFRKANSKEFLVTIKKADQYLKNSLKELKGREKLPVITAVGHSHIDVAWLWRLLETREKTARSFSTVLKLMDEYPDYSYLQSSPQLYQFIKEDYPEIYAKIKEKVKEGKWEVTGGMWVEADCNLSSGESLVRQFLYGQQFIKEEFDKQSTILWLPDVFGYSWALPQIIKKSGVKYFMTTKISWSQFNRPEYDTFNWRGIDGTDVLTHFITTPDIHNKNTFYTYNGLLNAEALKGLWDNYRQKDINDELLLAYGWGDGGGGPTREMLDNAKYLEEVPGIPKLKLGKAEPYFERLEQKVKGEKNLPLWDGELYLEYHRGTYTSQAEIKKNNRKAEILLHDTELFTSLAAEKDYLEFPRQILKENWQIVLKNQFHDILPGSSIKEVYEDSAAEFKEVFATGSKILKNSLEKIAAQIEGQQKKLVVFNTLPWQRSDYIDFGGRKIKVDEIPANGYKAYNIVESDSELKLEAEIEAQKKEDFKQSQINFLKAKAEAQIFKAEAQRNSLKAEPDKNIVENRYYKIKFNPKGHIISIYDREYQREIIAESKMANLLQVFEDRPMNYNAWDIDIYYQEKEYRVDDLKLMEIEKLKNRIEVKFKWEFLDSTIEQKMIIYANQRRIDFKTELDWQQEQLLLKTAFPLDLRTTRASYDIQFGNLERNTHWNTSWDYAQFETAAHKWADLSERDYGVSLLNDCKYGYDIKNQTLRLSLIKSAVEPDPEADQGQHSFTYSLYPHGGDWYQGDTVKEAYELNYPLQTIIREKMAENKKAEPQHKSFIEVAEESTILETVKKAENSDHLILRFYEYANRRDKVRVKIDQKIEKVVECNLLEEEIAEIEAGADYFEFEIKPYKIKSFKLKL